MPASSNSFGDLSCQSQTTSITKSCGQELTVIRLLSGKTFKATNLGDSGGLASRLSCVSFQSLHLPNGSIEAPPYLLTVEFLKGRAVCASMKRFFVASCGSPNSPGFIGTNS